MILVNPPQGHNQDMPNLALGFASGGHPVLDLNTGPVPYDAKAEALADGDFRYSVQQPSLAWVQARGGRSVTSWPDVQCCYKYLELDDNLFLPPSPTPDYRRFSSYPTFRKHWQDGSWAYPLLTSSGCPYGCTYCAARARRWNQREFRHIAVEVDNCPAKVLSVADDCFNRDTTHVLSVSGLLRGREWMCTNGLRADLLTEEQARVMSRSGCSTVAFGVEHPDDAVLRQINKGETLAQIERGIRIAKEHFPSVSVYLISGYGEGALDWAARLGVYVHLTERGSVPFTEIHTPLASPSGSLLVDRYRLARQWGWKVLPYVRMDMAKIWRRVTR